MKKSPFIIALFLTLFTFVNANAYNHPCLLHSREDFDYVKKHLTEEPYSSALVKLKSSQYAKENYKPSPVEYLARLDANNWGQKNSRWENAGIADLWYEGIHNNYTNFMRDAAAAYQLALLYSLENNEKAADAAKNIIVEWSKKNKGILRNKNGEIIDPNEKLIMFQPYQMAVAIEMLRDYKDWGKTNEFKDVLKWIDNSFYPLCHEHLELQNTSGGGHYWMNWDLASMTTILALGILTDNEAYVNEAINYYKGQGGGPGNIKKGVPYIHDDPDSKEILGQGNELGRDQGHNTLCVAVLGTFCEMALQIGEDLFAYDNYRAVALAEYVAKYNLAKENLYPNPMQNFSAMKVGSSNNDFEYTHSSFPFTTYTYGDQGTQREPSQDSRGTVRPGWDYWVGYCNQNGISSIYSTKFAERIRPDGGGGQYSGNSGGFDQIGFSTLMGYRPSEGSNSGDSGNNGGNDDRIDWQNGNVTLLPQLDTQVRKGNTTDFGNNPNMEIYYTLNEVDNSRDKEFYGLMKFDLPQQLMSSDYKIKEASLKLVCVQNKGNREIGLYKYNKAFSEHTTFEVEEKNIRTALAERPFATFSANGQGSFSMVDAGKDKFDKEKYGNAEAWTNYIDLTEYVVREMEAGETSISFLISKINPTAEAMRFATKEAGDIVNDNGVTFAAEDLVPILTVSFLGISDELTPGEGDNEGDDEEGNKGEEEGEGEGDEENKGEDDVDQPENPGQDEDEGDSDQTPDDEENTDPVPENPDEDDNPSLPGDDDEEEDDSQEPGHPGAGGDFDYPEEPDDTDGDTETPDNPGNGGDLDDSTTPDDEGEIDPLPDDPNQGGEGDEPSDPDSGGETGDPSDPDNGNEGENEPDSDPDSPDDTDPLPDDTDPDPDFGFDPDDNNGSDNEEEDPEEGNNAVDGIYSEDELPLYYDMNGIPVRHPQNGVMYLERKGKQVRKLIFHEWLLNEK